MGVELAESGYLIHSRPYKERALLLELFTLGRGRISAVCRMSKKNEANIKARLRSFEPLNFTLVQSMRSELMVLKEVQCIRCTQEIATPAVFCAEYLNELLHYLYRDDTGSPKLFSAYIHTLEVLRQDHTSAETELALRDFELQLLQDLGYAPDFVSPQGRWPTNAWYTYLPDTGFILTKIEGQSFISGSVLNELADGGKILSHAALRALKLITARAIATLLKGRTLKSRELYSNYLKLTA